MSAEIISLKEFRKQKRKRNKETVATQNRVSFGRTKAQRREEKIENQRQERALDGKQRDEPGDEPA